MTRKHVHDPRPYIRDVSGLIGLITAGCCWIRCWNKAVGLREAVVVDVAIAASTVASIAAALPVPRVMLAANAERE